MDKGFVLEQEETKEKPLTQWKTVNMKWVNTSPSLSLTAKEKTECYYTYGRYRDNSQYDHVAAYKKICYLIYMMA